MTEVENDNPATAMARLREAAAILSASGTAVAAWFVDAVRLYEAEAPDGLALDRALGLAPQPGGDGWWTIEARRKRNELIRRIGQHESYSALSISHAAREIAKAERKLRGVAHRRTGDGDPRDLIAAARETGQPFPSVRQIERILRQQF